MRLMESQDQLTGYLTVRMPDRLMSALGELARDNGTNVRALARTILEEGVRMRRYRGIVFRETAVGTREASMEGRRLYVWQVIETVRASKDPEEAAAYLGVRPDQVRSAMRYYVDFQAEIDGAIAENEAAEDKIRAADERLRAAFG